LVQQLAVAGAVFVVEEAGHAVLAALHDVLRDAGQVDAGLAGHACRIGRWRQGNHSRESMLGVGVGPVLT